MWIKSVLDITWIDCFLKTEELTGIESKLKWWLLYFSEYIAWWLLSIKRCRILYGQTFIFSYICLLNINLADNLLCFNSYYLEYWNFFSEFLLVNLRRICVYCYVISTLLHICRPSYPYNTHISNIIYI
jgi:hypothetical protein